MRLACLGNRLLIRILSREEIVGIGYLYKEIVYQQIKTKLLPIGVNLAGALHSPFKAYFQADSGVSF